MSPDLDPGTPPKGARIVVAMSGGVDSSAAAALLAESGYEVIGITLQLYDHGLASGRPGTCCAGQDIYDARRVADSLGIPHYVFDFEERFRERVMEPFAESYLRGETPIPCVLCNQHVKFADLLSRARELGAHALATGHYVRRRQTDCGPALYRAADGARDQSYFLSTTTREQLSELIFPLGDLAKSETRAIAKRFGLPVADKRDSQDICFVPVGGYARVIERLRPQALQPGEIMDGEGRVLGRHSGIAHFTIGQRRRLGVASDRPLFVIDLDPETNRVIAGPEEALLNQTLEVRGVNWLDDPPFTGEDIRADFLLRSSMQPCPGFVRLFSGGLALVTLDEPQRAVTPGQVCAIYRGERLLGGGWISRRR